MARSVWSGVITFGLVTVPVQLFTATETHTIHFHQLQRGTSDRVRNRRVNEHTGEEVPFDEIVKGFDTGEGEYVVVDPEELDDIAPGRSRAIDISGFVDLDSIDPVYFDRTYYLGPKGKEYAKVYALLREALESERKAGIATFVMRSHEYLVALEAEGGVLALHTLHWADEVRDPGKEIGSLPGKAKATSSELKMARQLIDTLSIDWKPDQWHDTFQEKVAQLLKAKQAGDSVEKAKPPPKSTNVVDLMEALQASVDRARSPKAQGKKSATGTRRPAQRRTTAASARGGKSAGKRTSTTAALRDLTKAELYQRAADADVPGRSSMNRDELIHALTPGTGHGARAS
ncbi:Ku protein [Streptomyces sp. Tue6028]|uniref:non-homologous end joining protein Ku n=2 Tax=Streptomyces sp. Tue6028 TaxID=2036037 RepID=UPI003D74EF7A